MLPQLVVQNISSILFTILEYNRSDDCRSFVMIYLVVVNIWSILWWNMLCKLLCMYLLMNNNCSKTIPIFIILIFLFFSDDSDALYHLYCVRDDHEQKDNYDSEWSYQIVWKCNSHFVIHIHLIINILRSASLEVFTTSLSMSGLSFKVSSKRTAMGIGM